MKVNLNATSFRLRDDTESVEATPGSVQFLKDHNVPFSRYTSPTTQMGNVVFGEKNMVQWHESDRTVDLSIDPSLNTIDQLIQMAEKYNATFEINDYGVSISFK